MSAFNGPITSGILGTVDKKNLSASYFAPANGGGGGNLSMNPVISSITTNGISSVNAYQADIQPASQFFTVASSTMTQFNVFGDSFNQVFFQGPMNSVDPTNNGIGSLCVEALGITEVDRSDMNFEISTINKYLSTFFPGVAHTYLEIQADNTNPSGNDPIGGTLELGALPDGRCYIGSGLQVFKNDITPSVSTLMLIADAVNISTLNVESINGAAYPPKAVLPSVAEFSSIGVGDATGLSISGFTQPLITYGSINLNASGTATVGMDRTYTDPYYPQVTYRGILGANTSTLSVSTIAGDSFQIYGEANTQVIYTVFGN